MLNWRIWALLVTALLCVSCANTRDSEGSDSNAQVDSTTPQVNSSPSTTIFQPSTDATPLIVLERGSGFDAGVSGVLRDDGHCLIVTAPDNQIGYPLIFSANGNPKYISANQIAFDGAVLKIGEPFSGHGGSITRSDAPTTFDPAGFGVPSDCEAGQDGVYILDRVS